MTTMSQYVSKIQICIPQTHTHVALSVLIAMEAMRKMMGDILEGKLFESSLLNTDNYGESDCTLPTFYIC